MHSTGIDMMKFKLALLTVLVSPFGIAVAQVNALPPTRHILVYGDAHARAIPDRFKIAIKFEAIDMDTDAARRKVEDYVKDVLAKLKAADVPSNEIVATSLQIGPRERYDQKLQDQVFLGTAVSRSLTAKFSKQSKLEAFLADIETSKELQVSEVTTEVSDEQALRKALREKAIDSSLEKAKTIAKAYGARVDKVYSVSDVAPQFEYGIREGNWPSSYQWSRSDSGSTTLDRIEVTGSRIKRTDIESFQTGYVSFEDKIYAVFLIAD